MKDFSVGMALVDFLPVIFFRRRGRAVDAGLI